MVIYLVFWRYDHSNEEICSNEIGFMRTADPSLAAIVHESARRARLVMTTFVVTFRNSIPAASTTPGRPSGKRSAYAKNASGLTPQHAQSGRVLRTRHLAPKRSGRDLSYNRGQIPRAARDFYEWRIRAGAASAPWATSKQTRLLRTPKNQERSFGTKASLRMTRAMNCGDDGTPKCTTCPGSRDAHLWFRGRSAGRAAWQ